MTPSGRLLDAMNSNDPNAIAGLLQRSLERYAAMSREERLGTASPAGGGTAAAPKGDSRYPEGGLVLRVTSRDLPRADAPKDWRAHAWNLDYAWFRAAESDSLLPERLEPGAERDAPRPLVERLARFHLIDNVFGQTTPYAREQVEVAELKVRVERLKKGVVELRLEGRTRVRQRGRWQIDERAASDQERSVECELLGSARWDPTSKRFTAFELVGLGERAGGTRYNRRNDDMGPCPLGFSLRLAEEDDRVAPAFLYDYGW